MFLYHDSVVETEQQRKERNRQEDLKRLRDFRPLDDDFMRCMFRDDIPLAQHVLRILIGKDDLELISIETQADMKRLVGARSLCLDAYGKDTAGKRYDLEIQRADKGAGAHRARYHSSVMDVENLDTSEDFDALPDTYAIFITENDIYGKGIPFYKVERINLGTGEQFGDGEHILYVNGAYEGDDPIGILMHDFRCSDSNDMLDDKMAAKTRYFKETEEGVEYMCKSIEDMRKETRIDDYVQAVTNLIKKAGFSLEKALDILDVPSIDRDTVISGVQILCHYYNL